MTEAWEGLLLLDKPSGPTSHRLVQEIRRATGQRRIGHAGTLDPMASGLLPLVLGRATRLVRFLPTRPKTYRGKLRLGLRTDSDDISGRVLTEHDGELPGEDAVRAAARELIGPSMQLPPRISAKKIEGQRMYRLARRGIDVAGRPAAVEVLGLDLEPTTRAAEYGFQVEVSAGTYVRALVRDLGDALGCGGTLLELRRTAIADLTPDPRLRGPGYDPRVLREALIEPHEMTLDLPDLRLTDRETERRIAAGAPQPVADGLPAGWCRILAADGSLLGVGELRERTLHPRVVLA